MNNASLNKLRTKVILEEFNKLDRKGLHYCIIRNFEFIQGNDPGKDIDITILKSQNKKIAKHLVANNFFKSNTNYASNHAVYSKYFPSLKRFISFHLHIGGVSGPDIMHYSAKLLIDNSKKCEGFTVPNDTYLLFGIIVHVLLDRRYLEDKYKLFFSNLSKMNVNYKVLEKELANFFKEPKNIISILKKKKFNQLKPYFVLGKKTYYSKMANIIKKIRFYLLTILWICTRFRNNLLVTIMGMDGTGKTTLINNIDELFNKSLIKQKTIYFGRGKNNILPIQRFGKSYFAKAQKNKKYDNSNKTKFIRICAAPIFALDLLLRYLTRVLPQLKNSDIVITDRFTPDILLMKHVPEFIKNIIYTFMPKPKMAFYLYNDPKILAKRKDHPLDDLKRQQKLFKKINKKVKPIKIKSINEQQTFNEVMVKILGQL